MIQMMTIHACARAFKPSRREDRDFSLPVQQRNTVRLAVDRQVSQFDSFAISRTRLRHAAVIDIDHRFHPQKTQESTPGVVAIASDTSIYAEEIYPAVSIRQPIVHKKMHALLSEGGLQFWRRIALHTLKYQVIYRSPDGAMPVRLPQKQRIVARDSGQDPLAPELLRIGHYRQHLVRALCIRRSTDERVEIRRRDAGQKIAGGTIVVVPETAAIES